MNYYIGWDNGATGSIGIVCENESFFFPTPVMQVPNYTKEVQMIGRIHLSELKKKFKEIIPGNITPRCLIERPFMAPVNTIQAIVDGKDQKIITVNMNFFKASLNAHRTFEASIILLESLKYGYEVVDSKAWQKNILGTGIIGSKALKEASKLRGIQLFPQHEETIRKHKDADGLLMAEFARRYFNQ